MADSMPAVSAQTPLQPGARKDNVDPARPIEAQAPTVRGPNPIDSGQQFLTSGGGAGSPLVSPASPLSAGVNRTRNGGEVQAGSYGEAWPTPKPDHGSSGDAPSGALGPDVRCIQIPDRPKGRGAGWDTSTGNRGTPSPAPRPV